MAVFFAMSESSARCWDHDDCREHEELGRACYESTHKHVWSARGEWYSENDGSPGKLTTYNVFESYTGRVVFKGVDVDVRVMSDVYDNVPYCVVLDTNGEYRKVETYQGPGAYPYWVPANYSEVDATPEMITAYLSHVASVQALKEESSRVAQAARRAKEIETERLAPKRGRTIKVVKGRKVPIGTSGVCFWVGDGAYGTRVGFKDDAGVTHWTAATNVVAV